MKCVEKLSPEALFDLDEIEVLPAFDVPDFMPDVPAIAFTFTEAETFDTTLCTYAVTVANLEAYNGVFCFAQSPFGLFLYEGYQSIARHAFAEKTAWGNFQGNVACGIMASLDVLGGKAVKTTAQLSGAAAGRGETGKSVAWGTASGGLIALNAVTFGRMASGIPNLGTWAQNPVLYEIGSKTLPTAVYTELGLEGLSQIDKGRRIVEAMGWLGALKPSVFTTAYGATISTGLTPGAWLALIGGTIGLDQGVQPAIDWYSDECKK